MKIIDIQQYKTKYGGVCRKWRLIFFHDQLNSSSQKNVRKKIHKPSRYILKIFTYISSKLTLLGSACKNVGGFAAELDAASILSSIDSYLQFERFDVFSRRDKHARR